jgi:hypothetical protein
MHIYGPGIDDVSQNDRQWRWKYTVNNQRDFIIKYDKKCTERVNQATMSR